MKWNSQSSVTRKSDVINITPHSRSSSSVEN